MPELRVVAVSNDGTRLVLKAADSTEYTLPIDERLRAAVRNDRARLGQIEIEVESHLRPRDIQARIRAGASAEEVAQLAGIPVDRVRRFEGPVLAERAFMAERARKTPVRRPGENTGPQLGEAVQERLLLRGADKDSVQWDSWRRDDGTWEVLLVYRVATEPHAASWTYDPPRRPRPGRRRRGPLADRRERRHPRAELPVRAEDRPTAPGPAAGPRPGPAVGAPHGARAGTGGGRERLAHQPPGGRAELPGRHGGARAARRPTGAPGERARGGARGRGAARTGGVGGQPARRTRTS